MIIIENGNILNSSMQTIINPVNCVGIMGKGLALSYKKKYPEMFNDYKDKCKNNEIKIGKPHIYKINSEFQILNFPTKIHYRNKSHINYIESSLKFIVENYKSLNITSLAIPRIGCGLGGLDWENEVYPLILSYIKSLDIPIEIYT